MRRLDGMHMHALQQHSTEGSSCTEADMLTGRSMHAQTLQGKPDASGKGGGGGMFRGLIDTIIGNLQLSIANVHIRYEARLPTLPLPPLPLPMGGAASF
jgi:hypothetical protein